MKIIPFLLASLIATITPYAAEKKDIAPKATLQMQKNRIHRRTKANNTAVSLTCSGSFGGRKL